MLLSLLLLQACGGPVEIQPDQGGCTDYNFASPGESTVEWEEAEDGSIRVWRTNAVLDGTGLIFDPVITAEGTLVEVFEKWVGGETADAFCYEPSVSIRGLGGKLQVRWYLAEGDGTPYDTVDIE